jgi:3-deoxy-7-phosphoheptulonate synthase
VLAQRLAGNAGIKGLMLESHLVAGRQDTGGTLTYGQSITDACLGFAETRDLLRELADAVS